MGGAPQKGQKEKKPEKDSTHPYGSYEVLTLIIGPFFGALLLTYLTFFDQNRGIFGWGIKNF